MTGTEELNFFDFSEKLIVLPHVFMPSEKEEFRLFLLHKNQNQENQNVEPSYFDFQDIL